jgi:hypothetical protein
MVHNTVGQSSLVAVFTINGGSITAKGGDIFYTTGSKSTLTVKGATTINASTGNIVNAASSSNVTFKMDGATLTGKLTTDATSSISATLQNSSSLTGNINTGNTASSITLTMDASSSWTLNANSYLSSIINTSGISGTSITNITGNGYNVYYNSNLSANSYLGGKTYSLVNGGKLMPQGTSEVEEKNELPSEYKLNQNYPNPFNPSTIISYQLPLAGYVTLKVFDVLGNEVSVLVDEFQNAGNYNSQFSILNSKLSSGLYFYKLQSGNFISTKKMILMK